MDNWVKQKKGYFFGIFLLVSEFAKGNTNRIINEVTKYKIQLKVKVKVFKINLTIIISCDKHQFSIPNKTSKYFY